MNEPTSDTLTSMQRGDRLRLRIDTLGYGGEGVGRSDGVVVFVPRGVPGDEVEVTLGRVKKRHAAGRITRILSPSPSRVDAPCPLFDDGSGPTLGCGGCQWLHIDYGVQTAAKARVVEDALRRIGNVEAPVAPVAAAEEVTACRNKLSASIGSKGVLGLCIEHSPEVLELTGCPMEVAPNNAALESIQQYFAGHRERLLENTGLSQVHLRNAPDGAVSLCLYAEKRTPDIDDLVSTLLDRRTITVAGMLAGRKFSHLGGGRSLRVHAGRIDYDVPIDTFFQTHYGQAERLLELVRTGLEAKPGDRLLDLYAGVGFFALDAALDGAEVTAVEGHPAANAAAARTAKRLGVGGSYLRLPVDARLFAGTSIKKRYDLVVLDPPRAGCGPETATAICSLGARRIVYVSCAPDTLARDLAAMAASGYRITRITPLDMFPQTYHVEVVAELEAVET